VNLAGRAHWVFDLDGTLTVAVHDFAEIRRMLGLPAGVGILEALDALPPTDAAPLWKRLDDFEYELAGRAVAAEGATTLLDALARRGAKLGILTRNNRLNAVRTLGASGLSGFFADSSLMTRERSRPKPDPEGIRLLLERWSADPTTAVMIGDHRIDIEVGRSAGLATVLVDVSGTAPWHGSADVTVRSLGELAAMLSA
jgi:HAD superfamily hydrolase (TIGR01509 family)